MGQTNIDYSRSGSAAMVYHCFLLLSTAAMVTLATELFFNVRKSLCKVSVTFVRFYSNSLDRFYQQTPPPPKYKMS